MCGLEGTGQDSIMSDAGKDLWSDPDYRGKLGSVNLLRNSEAYSVQVSFSTSGIIWYLRYKMPMLGTHNGYK
tara:strand:- start:1831 stop:2046 length:216 start_codon:yes stop_codon:yes gene_type:complete